MFRLVSDNDSHWFIIPVDKSKAWTAWREIGERDPEDAEGWDVPEWARHVDGPHAFVFDVWGLRA